MIHSRFIFDIKIYNYLWSRQIINIKINNIKLIIFSLYEGLIAYGENFKLFQKDYKPF